jgi:hypothetical protein
MYRCLATIDVVIHPFKRMTKRKLPTPDSGELSTATNGQVTCRLRRVIFHATQKQKEFKTTQM